MAIASCALPATFRAGDMPCFRSGHEAAIPHAYKACLSLVSCFICTGKRGIGDKRAGGADSSQVSYRHCTGSTLDSMKQIVSGHSHYLKHACLELLQSDSNMTNCVYYICCKILILPALR